MPYLRRRAARRQAQRNTARSAATTVAPTGVENMNGQTGKMVSDLPVSRKRYWTWWAGITAGISAAVALVGAVAAAL